MNLSERQMRVVQMNFFRTPTSWGIIIGVDRSDESSTVGNVPEPKPSVTDLSNPEAPARASCGLALTSARLGSLSLLVYVGFVVFFGLALVTGQELFVIGGILCIALAPVPAIGSVICGQVALSRISKSDHVLTGKELAMAGRRKGYLSLGLFVLLAAIALPNFIKERNTPATSPSWGQEPSR